MRLNLKAILHPAIGEFAHNNIFIMLMNDVFHVANNYFLHKSNSKKSQKAKHNEGEIKVKQE